MVVIGPVWHWLLCGWVLALVPLLLLLLLRPDLGVRCRCTGMMGRRCGKWLICLICLVYLIRLMYLVSLVCLLLWSVWLMGLGLLRWLIGLVCRRLVSRCG